jgi:peroxiredoxin
MTTTISSIFSVWPSVRRVRLQFIALAIGLFSSAFADQPAVPGLQTLAIGDKAPDFSLPGIDGKTWRLADFKSDILMVYFTSNHCPVCHAADPRLVQLVKKMSGQSFEVVAINPNNDEGLKPEEFGFSLYTDSFEDMTPYAKDAGFTFPYLYDGETQATAKAYGCIATPQVMLFDRERRLRYVGAFDDSRFAAPETVKKAHTQLALEAMLSGQPVPLEMTKPFGCSTKWLEKKTSVAEAEKKHQEAEITLADITAKEITALMKNPTKKYRLVNVWATTCAPCVKEFPALTAISRRLALRPFELITLSTDAPSDRERVRAFLSKNRAVTPSRLKASLKEEGRLSNNYLYTEASIDDLIQAVDPAWKGSQPYTVLVAPGGSIVWRHEGEVTEEMLLKETLKALTPYYQPE